MSPAPTLVRLVLSSLAVALMLPAVPAAGQPVVLFIDGFESGDTLPWTQTVPPLLAACDCYFSSDCFSGNFCQWGILTQEDNCAFRDNKPMGNPGTGCDVDHPGPWGGNICDGICVPASEGSAFALEDRGLLTDALRTWGQAILYPSVEGGGPVDGKLADEALALPFSRADVAWQLGRHTTELLVLTSARGFYEHFCHFEMAMPGALGIDLSKDPCAVEVGRIALDALLAEIASPGLGKSVLGQVALLCPSWQGVPGSRCGGHLDAVACLEGEVAHLARYLATPPAFFSQAEAPSRE